MGTTLKKLQDKITKLKEESKKTGVDNKDKIKEVQRQIKKKKAYDKEYMRKYYLNKIKPDRQAKPPIEHTLTCTVCGTEFKAGKLGIKYCPECRKKVANEKRKEYMEKHKEEYLKRQRVYRQTEAYKNAQKKYRESEKGRKHMHDYYQKPEVKERMREYQKTEKAKEYRKQYQASKRMSIKQARAIIEKAKELGINVEEIS